MTVQTSMWLMRENNSIDANAPTGLNPQNAEIGVLTIGGSKTKRSRWVAQLDLYSETPREGRVLKSSDTVLTAELWGDVPIVTGTSGFGCTIDRITPTDYDYTTSNWNNKKTATTWPTAGGEISTPQATFNSPTATGYQKVTDQLVGLVNNAITSQSGVLRIRIMATSEGASDHYFVIQSDPDNEAPAAKQARLIVTYESPQPGPTLMGLSPGII